MMKKWTSLAVLGLASASLLVACGSKKEENKSSAKEAQTTVKSSQKKAKAASGKKETKATETASQEGAQAASQDAANSGQTAAGSGAASTDKATDSSQMVPEELVGTWTGTTEIAKDVQMTVAADGTVTTTANFYQADLNPVRTATTKAKAVQASGNVYYWESEGLNGADALLPGITGLGVANFRFKPGFILEEGHYTPIAFTTDINTEFDYSNYRDFHFSLTKEQ